jgi:hypothetical protein
MFWLIYAVGAILFLVAAMVLAGLKVPREHTASRAARFRQPMQRVFEIISGPPDWRPEVLRYEMLPPANGKKRWREVWKRHQAFIVVLEEAEPPFRIVNRIADENHTFAGTWTQELQEVPEGTLLRVTEAGEIHNPLFRFLSRYVIGYHRSIERYLHALARKLDEQANLES